MRFQRLRIVHRDRRLYCAAAIANQGETREIVAAHKFWSRAPYLVGAARRRDRLSPRAAQRLEVCLSDSLMRSLLSSDGPPGAFCFTAVHARPSGPTPLSSSPPPPRPHPPLPPHSRST